MLRHIRVSLVTGLLPQKLQNLFEIAALFIGAMMSGYATYYMFGLVRESIEYGDKSSGMISIPLWIPQTPVLVGLCILTIALLDEMSSVLRGQRPTYEGRGENLLSE